jgi:hypothetical protein
MSLARFLSGDRPLVSEGKSFMKVTKIQKIINPIVLSICILIIAPQVAVAHCDTMDGPVVKAARESLKTRNVNLALIWVQQKDEPEVKQAFRQTLAVRKLNRSALKLADKYFFETVVRLHRAGEGEPYTGLKPAGSDLGPVIPVADRALEDGSIQAVLKLFPASLKPEIESRFHEAIARKRFDKNDVEAGRAYVSAYVSFLEYLERLHEERAGH